MRTVANALNSWDSTANSLDLLVNKPAMLDCSWEKSASMGSWVNMKLNRLDSLPDTSDLLGCTTATTVNKTSLVSSSAMLDCSSAKSVSNEAMLANKSCL